MTASEQNGMQSVWDLPGSLSDMSWFRDWDYYIASFSSVQKYWHDSGTFPIWNFHFCGGRPEIANPQNWTLTWLHPFIYLLSPVHLILAFWFIMTLIGSIATAAIIQRRTLHWPTALLAGSTYGLSGYFGAHFNQGVFTFAFMHLVPVMMLITDIRIASPTTKNSVWLFLASFAFFTAALPHGIFYFYPAYLVFSVCTIFFYNRKKFILNLVDTIYPHVLGAGAACYKLIPVVAWQRIYPRQGVQIESLHPLDMLKNLIRTDSNYDNMFAQAFDGQFWFLWEYNAFIGVIPIVAAVLTIFFAWRFLAKKSSQQFNLIVLGLILICTGVALASGNELPVSPGYWFKNLPLVGGIRVFGRFQIVIVFGIVLIFGVGLSQMFKAIESWSKTALMRPVAVALVTGLTLLPLLFQNGLHLKNIRGVPFSALDEVYQPKASKELTLAGMNADFIATGMTHHDYILRQNGIVSNCYDPLTVERPPVTFSPERRWLDLSIPVATKVSIHASSMEMSFDHIDQQGVTLNLTKGDYPISFSVTPNTIVNEWGKSQPNFKLTDKNTLRINAALPGWSLGWILTAFSFLAFTLIEGRKLKRISSKPI